MQTITEIAKQKMLGNQRLIGLLMALFDKSSFTINRWIESRDIRLTTPAAIEIIRQETKLTDGEILEGFATAKTAA